MRKAFLFGICAILGGRMDVVLANEQQECLEILKNAVQSREALRSGEMTIDLRILAARREQKTTYRVWFDHPKIRIDELRSADGNTPVWRKNIFSGTEYLRYIGVAPGEEPYPLEISKGAASTTNPLGIFDPRMIGMFTGGFGTLHVRKWSSLYVPPAPNDCAKDPASTKDSLRINFRLSKGQQIAMQIDRAKSYAVEKVSLATSKGGMNLREDISAQYPPAMVSGAWWPTRVERKFSMDGKVVEDETVTFSKVKLNHSIEPSVFTPAGMDVPVNKMVIDYPPYPAGTRMWDGKNLVPLGSPTISTDKAEWSMINFWTLAGLLLAGLAVIALLAARRFGRTA